MVAQHRAQPAALNGKSVGEMISEERAYLMAVNMTASARAADREHRQQMAALITVAAQRGTSTAGFFNLTLSVRNRAAKAIRSLDIGIEVHDASGKRLGLAEFETNRVIAPHAEVRFNYALPYSRFGGDANDVRKHQGPLTLPLDVKSITYTNGSSAGRGD